MGLSTYIYQKPTNSKRLLYLHSKYCPDLISTAGFHNILLHKFL